MKLKSLLLLLSLVLIGGMTLVSCNDDDDDNNDKSAAIAGTWKMSDMVGGFQKYYYFLKNGYMAEINVKYVGSVATGYFFNVKDYKIDGNLLTIGGVSAPFKSTKETLTLTFGKDEMEFFAVDESEVKEYIDNAPNLLLSVWSKKEPISDGANHKSFIIVDANNVLEYLDVYFDDYGLFQKSHITYGTKWSFANLIYKVEKKKSIKKYMIEVDNVIWDNLRLSWYDNNHNLVTDEYERYGLSDIQEYLDNATE